MKSSEWLTSKAQPRELQAAFDAYLRRNRQLSERTLATYGINGRHMIEFFRSHDARTIDDVMTPLADHWMDWMLARKPESGERKCRTCGAPRR